MCLIDTDTCNLTYSCKQMYHREQFPCRGCCCICFLSRNWLLVWVSLWVIDSNTVFTFSWLGCCSCWSCFRAGFGCFFFFRKSCQLFEFWPASFICARLENCVWDMRSQYVHLRMYTILENHKYLYSIFIHKYQRYIRTNISIWYINIFIYTYCFGQRDFESGIPPKQFSM